MKYIYTAILLVCFCNTAYADQVFHCDCSEAAQAASDWADACEEWQGCYVTESQYDCNKTFTERKPHISKDTHICPSIDPNNTRPELCPGFIERNFPALANCDDSNHGDVVATTKPAGTEGQATCSRYDSDGDDNGSKWHCNSTGTEFSEHFDWVCGENIYCSCGGEENGGIVVNCDVGHQGTYTVEAWFRNSCDLYPEDSDPWTWTVTNWAGPACDALDADGDGQEVDYGNDWENGGVTWMGVKTSRGDIYSLGDVEGTSGESICSTVIGDQRWLPPSEFERWCEWDQSSGGGSGGSAPGEREVIEPGSGDDEENSEERVINENLAKMDENAERRHQELIDALERGDADEQKVSSEDVRREWSEGEGELISSEEDMLDKISEAYGDTPQKIVDPDINDVPEDMREKVSVGERIFSKITDSDLFNPLRDSRIEASGSCSGSVHAFGRDISFSICGIQDPLSSAGDLLVVLFTLLGIVNIFRG